MKTLLVGSFGAHNVGDALILCAALEAHPNAQVMTADASASEQFCERSISAISRPPVGFRSLFRFMTDAAYRADLRSLQGVEQVVFAGGGLLAGRLRAYWVWALTAAWLRLLCPRAQFVWRGQGMDQTHNLLKRQLTRIALRGAHMIETRDALSQAQLADLSIASELGFDTAEEHLRHALFTAMQSPQKVLINVAKPITDTQWNELSAAHGSLEFVVFDARDVAFAPMGVVVHFPQTKTELMTLLANTKLMLAERLHTGLVCRALGVYWQLWRQPYAPKVRAMLQ